jgi:hypothetical protein
MGATESWPRVNAQGKLVLYTENDGPRFLRRGAEACEEEIVLKGLEGSDPHLYREVVELLRYKISTDREWVHLPE